MKRVLTLTKSISRFARNTTDCLETVRYLKSLGVAVFFERKNINTLSAESELLLSVLSSIAQEESRSISDNLRWAYQKKFRKGKVAVITSRFLGYAMDENCQLKVNQQEAEIVKRIFREYIAGKSIRTIITGLQADNIKTVTGMDCWPEGKTRAQLISRIGKESHFYFISCKIIFTYKDILTKIKVNSNDSGNDL